MSLIISTRKITYFSVSAMLDFIRAEHKQHLSMRPNLFYIFYIKKKIVTPPWDPQIHENCAEKCQFSGVGAIEYFW